MSEKQVLSKRSGKKKHRVFYGESAIQDWLKAKSKAGTFLTCLSMRRISQTANGRFLKGCLTLSRRFSTAVPIIFSLRSTRSFLRATPTLTAASAAARNFRAPHLSWSFCHPRTFASFRNGGETIILELEKGINDLLPHQLVLTLANT